MQPPMTLRRAPQIAGITAGTVFLVGAAWILVIGPLVVLLVNR
jgi:hypothetical protein